MFYKLIEKYPLRPVAFHSLRHGGTSLKLSGGNIEAAQGDSPRRGQNGHTCAHASEGKRGSQ